MELLRRRPGTIRDVSHGLGIPAAEASKHLVSLRQAGMIVIRRKAGQVFYVVSASESRSPFSS